MRMLLKGAVIALALAGTALATASPANAAGIMIGTSDHGRHHASTAVMFDFGNVAFAYNDGYWDNDHHWHRWRNSREHRDYRDQHRDHYRNGRHYRYRGHGWQDR